MQNKTAFVDRLLRRLFRNASGNVTILTALLLPVLIGFTGLGVDAVGWIQQHRRMQSAADSSALSAAVAQVQPTLQASAVAATYGFVNGINGISVTINQPPSSGPSSTVASAVEVIISASATPRFSSFFLHSPVAIKARSVAVATGKGCVFALNSSAAGAISVQGSNTINLQQCGIYANSSSSTSVSVGGSGSITALTVNTVGGISGQSNITTTQAIRTYTSATVDPYSTRTFGTVGSCTYSNFSTNGTTTIYPGVYCGGINIGSGGVITASPGVYYLDGGSLSISGSATLQGTGVTFVFTSTTGSNYATATISGGASVSISAPVTGATAGIVLFGDRSMPTGTVFKMGGGTSQSLSGAVYLPSAALQYSGGSSSNNGCTQIVADTIKFTGNSTLSINCSAYGTSPLGTAFAKLKE